MADTVLQLPKDQLQLDGDLNPPHVPGIADLTEWCTVNQAVGVFVGRGDTIPFAQSTHERNAPIVDLDSYRAAKMFSNF